MRGICISFNPGNVGTIWPEPADPTPPVYAVPPDDTPFCFFFRPVFPHMRELFWFASNFQSTPFVRLIYDDGGEERLDAAQMDVGLDNLNCVLHRPGTLPELAPYLYSDWINLIGLRCSEANAIATAQRLAHVRGEFDRYVDENAEIAFHCMDGFWGSSTRVTLRCSNWWRVRCRECLGWGYGRVTCCSDASASFTACISTTPFTRWTLTT